MCIYGGYKTQTVTQIASLIGCYDAGEISSRALRVYLAALVSVASREAAKRVRGAFGRKSDVTPRFLKNELSRLTELPLRSVSKEIRALTRIGLLSFGLSEIVFADNAHPECLDVVQALAFKRSELRPVPLPRTLLRYLARSSQVSLIKTALFYAVRGLTISRTGTITGKGSVKATEIARVFGMSERSVRSARSKLLELGFITDDDGSHQLKLNRTGAYFTVNMDWREPKRTFLSTAHFAPHPVKNRQLFAPPYKDRKTPYGSKNQKTHPERLNPSGLCMAKTSHLMASSPKDLAPPNIRDIRAEDLKSFGRVEELFRQAVKVGLVDSSEASAINFIGAAARASSVEGDAPRIFMGIIKGKLWKNITQADEDRALGALRRFRADDPDRFRVAA